MTKEFDPIISQKATEFYLRPDLVKAIMRVESSFNHLAVRYEPNWKYLLTPDVFSAHLGITAATETVLQSCSWGLMQVMGSVARELGFRGALQSLCEPSLGIHFGCAQLNRLAKKYAGNDLVAAYNAGSPRKDKNGKYLNHDYVLRINIALSVIAGGSNGGNA